jgi:twitching motility two-component system response regulator PilG
MTHSKLAGVRVMIVDDSMTIRRSAELLLGPEGCDVIHAVDGFDALGKITNRNPDLIFVDLVMPRLNGYQTCALLRRNGKYGATPVVMLSSKDNTFDKAQGRMAGCDDHLAKPFTKENLLSAVRAHVARCR